MKQSNSRTRFLAVLMSLVLAISFCGVGADGSRVILADETDKTITIFHTNDIHGNIKGSDYVIGMDQIAAMKQNTKNSILIDAGDATQGVPFARLTKGDSVIRIMNQAGYDGMVCGNHEFDYGQDILLQNAENASFPIVGANIVKEGTSFFKGTYDNGTKENNGKWFIKEVDGVKIGFFGLTTAHTKTSEMPAYVDKITFASEIDTAKQIVPELKEAGATIIIAVTHMGNWEAEGCTSVQLADALEGSGVAAIIDGHSHSIENEMRSGILIVQIGTASANLGQLTLSIGSDGAVKEIKEQMLTVQDMKEVAPVDTVTKAIEDVSAQQEELLKRSVGSVSTTLWGGYVENIAICRCNQTNLGDFVTDAMLAEAKERIAAGQMEDKFKDELIVSAINGGSVRDSLKKGTLTAGDLTTVFPFGNQMVLLEVTPKVLYDMMEQSVSNITGIDKKTGQFIGTAAGGFLQVGGMKVVFDPEKKAGKKVKSIVLNGQKKKLKRTDSTTKLLLATIDFIASGGSDYGMLAEIDPIGECGVMDEILEKALQTDTKKYQKEQERVQPVYQGPATYQAKLYLKDSDGNVLAGQTVTCYVDGKKGKTVTSNKKGIIKLKLSHGAHTISLSKKDPGNYVNDYVGLGTQEILDGIWPTYYPSLVVKNVKSNALSVEEKAA